MEKDEHARELEIYNNIKQLETELREIKKNKTYQKLIIKNRSPADEKILEKYKLNIKRKSEIIRNYKNELNEIRKFQAKMEYNHSLRNPEDYKNPPRNPPKKLPKNSTKINMNASKLPKTAPVESTSQKNYVYKHQQKSLSDRLLMSPTGSPPERLPSDPPLTVLPKRNSTEKISESDFYDNILDELSNQNEIENSSSSSELSLDI